MKKVLPLLACIAVAACQHDSIPTAPDNSRPNLSIQPNVQAAEEVVPGRILVKFQPGTSAAAVAAAYGLSIAGRGYADAFVILRGAALGNERVVAARLGGDARVIYAEPDYRRRFTAVDPRLWAFYNPGNLAITFTQGPSKGAVVSSYLSRNDADEDNVENYVTTGGNVIIGSIDTGVDFDHPEFSGGTLIAGHDWVSDDADPSDQNGHGTHTTGTMAGHTVGVAGVSGAGSRVKVHVQRVCGQQFCESSAIANAINAAAVYPGMVAVNVSIGGASESSAEADAIANATSHNVLVIASAGNGGTGTVECPACDPLAISVAAGNWRDEQTYYTSWGNGLDLFAPGGEMYSNTTEESGIYSAWPGATFKFLQGTSMAAPQVTGTAAIVASVLGLRGQALRNRLLGTADDLGAGGYDTRFGNGRLNAYRAVTGSTPPGESSGGGATLAAAFTFSCRGGNSCSFDGSNSTLATSWNWNFGDGGTTTGAQVNHTFAVGTWTVTLTVGGGGGSSASTSQTVSCATKGPKIRCG